MPESPAASEFLITKLPVGFAIAIMPAPRRQSRRIRPAARPVRFPSHAGPSQTRAEAEGNAYFEREFSKLDYIKKATIEK
jgi:hypothetical protein